MDDRVDAAILELCARRGRTRSICPSEAARVLVPEGEDWRPLMARVRRRALALARAGSIEILRKGRPVADLEQVRGVIRLRIAAGGAKADTGTDGEGEG
jgi:hypothetical protein